MSFTETTKPLLKPEQLKHLLAEEARVEEVLRAPPHIANLVHDRSALSKQLRTMRREREEQTAHPYLPSERDDAVRRERELREQWTSTGMLTQAEMRANPAGAVDRHRAWERRNKGAILEWKNIMRRLHASPSGAPGHVDSEQDLANIERFRPVESGQSLSLDTAQIRRAEFHMPFRPESVVMSAEESAVLKYADPETHSGMALFSPAQREAVLALVREAIAADREARPEPEPAAKGAKGRRPLTDEERQERSEKMKAFWDEKRHGTTESARLEQGAG